jgi:misacylated tRNA(Ala) deacylase
VEEATTEQLYQRDSYLRVFDATVLDVGDDGRTLILDRTAFYPGGGGQPHDVGLVRVGGVEFGVTRVKRQGEYIWHWIDGGNPWATGARVEGEIDWERRYKLMRTHTALHVLCGVVWRDYGAQVTGGNMAPLAGRMDFEFETLHKELVQEIEERVNAEIHQAHEVHVDILPRAEAFQIADLIRTKNSTRRGAKAPTARPSLNRLGGRAVRKTASQVAAQRSVLAIYGCSTNNI